MRLRRQFSLKHLLLLMVASAVAILVYQRFIYVHPAHRANPLYEKSPPITGGRVKIETCELSIRSVARSDRDGTILVENGFGRKLTAKVDNAGVLKKSGAWLDTTQIEFDVVGGEIDMYGFRVFDHESRMMLSDVSKARGLRRVGESTLQVYGLGEKLPDRVDVFMRVRCYHPSNIASRLSPNAGATCTMQDGVIRIDQIIRGMTGYTSEKGFTTSPEQEQNSTFVLLAFDGDWPRDAKYEVSAITKQGERGRNDRYIRPPGAYLMPDGTRLEGVRFNLSCEEIDHIEVRPLGNYKTFFFDGLRLPKTSTAKFQQPPNPIFQVDGVAKEFVAKELLPLDVSFRLIRGDAVTGSSAYGSHLRLSYRDEPTNPETETTLVGRVHGISEIGWDLLLTPNARRMGTRAVYGGGRWMGAYNYRVPLEDVKQLKIQMPSP